MRSSILIAGGGLAGSAAGCILAAAGKEVTIIEREARPTHKICGEFLSIEAQTYLSQIGLDVRALGGHPISRLRLTSGKDTIEADLPFVGLGLSRLTLDEALLIHAESKGVKLLRGHAVASIENSTTIKLANGKTLTANEILLATGKHDIRGFRRPTSASDNLVGFKMHFRLQPNALAQLNHVISLILFRDGYAGIQLIEHGHANLCLLVKRKRFANLGGKWSALLNQLCLESPPLAHLLEGATPLLPQPLSIYRVPYGFIHRPLAGQLPAVFRLGDQAAVIPSFTGDGMSIALHTAHLASAACLSGASAAEYHLQLAADVSAQIKRANHLYNLASYPATHMLFFKILKTMPKLLNIAAGLTRIPEHARNDLRQRVFS